LGKIGINRHLVSCTLCQFKHIPAQTVENSNGFRLLTQATNILSEIRVEGLETLDYLDNLNEKERFTEQGDAIVFEAEVTKLVQCHM
jgi:hypothetical protein